MTYFPTPCWSGTRGSNPVYPGPGPGGLPSSSHPIIQPERCWLSRFPQARHRLSSPPFRELSVRRLDITAGLKMRAGTSRGAILPDIVEVAENRTRSSTRAKRDRYRTCHPHVQCPRREPDPRRTTSADLTTFASHRGPAPERKFIGVSRGLHPRAVVEDTRLERVTSCMPCTCSTS
jgi:hypothetical protein